MRKNASEQTCHYANNEFKEKKLLKLSNQRKTENCNPGSTAFDIPDKYQQITKF